MKPGVAPPASSKPRRWLFPRSAKWRAHEWHRAATIRLTRSKTRQLRKCACCGAPTPTQSMCACWAHWMALPEDLRSELLKSYGRDEFANYHRNILKAVEIWRRLGVRRVAIDED